MYADRLLRCPSDLDGDMLTARDHVAVKTAMEKRQAREREGYQRQTAFAAYRMSVRKSFLYYPLLSLRAASVAVALPSPEYDSLWRTHQAIGCIAIHHVLWQ